MKPFCCLLILGCLTLRLPAQNWDVFDQYHETITRKEFCRLIDRVYNPSKAVYAYLNVTDEVVEFFEDAGKTNLVFSLCFAAPDGKPLKGEQNLKNLAQLPGPAKTARAAAVSVPGE